MVTLASYALVYTPLKRVTSLATVVGAVPGALPPVIGWAAARGSLGLEAWVLFAIVFVWQMPHVLAVSWLYREDYARGGIRVLPVEDPDGRSTAFQMVNYAAALVPVSLMPTVVGHCRPRVSRRRHRARHRAARADHPLRPQPDAGGSAAPVRRLARLPAGPVGADARRPPLADFLCTTVS